MRTHDYHALHTLLAVVHTVTMYICSHSVSLSIHIRVQSLSESIRTCPNVYDSVCSASADVYLFSISIPLYIYISIRINLSLYPLLYISLSESIHRYLNLYTYVCVPVSSASADESLFCISFTCSCI